MQQHLITCILFSLIVTNHATAIMQNPKLTNMDDGFLELKPNGSLILPNNLNNSSNVWQDTLVFKAILRALRLMPLQTKNTLSDLNQKIYGDGVEHKFPPFLERVIQRIQTYFSIYKYTDTSQPNWDDTTTLSSTTTLSETLNETLTLGQNEIDVNLTSDYSGFSNHNKTSSDLDRFKRPLNTTTSTTATTKSAIVYGENEKKKFIETKTGKMESDKKIANIS